jgi:hypothetical protein
MSTSRYVSRPDPEIVPISLAAAAAPPKFTQVEEGGWTFDALAQAYDIVNDRLMRFGFGCARKTIKESVPSGRVKIERGHPWQRDDRTTVGNVRTASEDKTGSFGPGLYYNGFISKAEGDLVTKMSEKVIDENSLVLFVMQEKVAEVEIEEVPEMARRWAYLTPKGKAEIRQIVEFKWLSIGLLPASSQGVPCIVNPPQLIPYQDLPLAAVSTSWDSNAAAQRLQAWATDGRSGEINRARLAAGYLARGSGAAGGPVYLGQVADVVDGQLVVVPRALDKAFHQLEDLLGGDPATLAAAARTLGRYEGRLTLGDHQADDDPEIPALSARPVTPPAEILSGAVPARPATPPAETTLSEDAARVDRLRRLQVGLLQLQSNALGGALDEPGSASEESP